ncbi:MAG TPA: hypothetical protein VK988_17705 [Acidimicrobiales bacterium]|nr:hypothetical protein [Acidimicrobiales bacterium]
MSRDPFRSWLDRLIELAVGLVVAGLLLTWAWQLLHPLVPMLLIGTALAVLGGWLLHRRHQW